MKFNLLSFTPLFSTCTLFLVWFLYIFGPLLDGFGQAGDVSTLISLFFIIRLFKKNNTLNPPLISLIVICLTIYIFTAINLIILDLNEVEMGIRALLRPLKAILYMLGGYSIVIYTLEKKDLFKEYSLMDIITILIYACILCHSMIMIAQFLFPGFRNFIYNFTTAKYTLQHYQHFRMAGLSGGGGAQLSAVQSLSIPIGFYLLNKMETKWIYIIGMIPIFFSILLSGRTGLLTLVLSITFYSMLWTLKFLSTLKINKRLISSMVICALLLPILMLLLNMLLENHKYFYLAFDRTFDAIINLKNTGSESTVVTLLNMFIFPSNFSHLLIGKASFLSINTYYKYNTDIGYIQLIWAYGMIGLFLHCLFYIYMLLHLSYDYQNNATKSACHLVMFIIFLILVFNLKEKFFFAKYSFQITIGLFFAITLKQNTIRKCIKNKKDIRINRLNDK